MPRPTGTFPTEMKRQPPRSLLLLLHPRQAYNYFLASTLTEGAAGAGALASRRVFKAFIKLGPHGSH